MVQASNWVVNVVQARSTKRHSNFGAFRWVYVGGIKVLALAGLLFAWRADRAPDNAKYYIAAVVAIATPIGAMKVLTGGTNDVGEQ